MECEICKCEMLPSYLCHYLVYLSFYRRYNLCIFDKYEYNIEPESADITICGKCYDELNEFINNKEIVTIPSHVPIEQVKRYMLRIIKGCEK